MGMLQFIVLSGPDKGREASLENGSRIGRGAASGLRLSDRSISRDHASVESRDGVWFVVDQGSTNGLWDGDERVSEIELTDQREVRLGEVILLAQFAEATPAASLAAAPAPAPRPAPREEAIQFSSGGGAIVDEPAGDIDLDIEWSDEDDVAGESAPTAAPKKARPAVRDLQREEILRSMQPSKGGLARADMSQLPGWVRALLALGVALASAGVFYAVMQGVKSTRG